MRQRLLLGNNGTQRSYGLTALHELLPMFYSVEFEFEQTYHTHVRVNCVKA